MINNKYGLIFNIKFLDLIQEGKREHRIFNLQRYYQSKTIYIAEYKILIFHLSFITYHFTEFTQHHRRRSPNRMAV